MNVYSYILKELGKEENKQLKKDWNQDRVGLIPKCSLEQSKKILKIDTAKAKKERQVSCDSDKDAVFSQSEKTLWKQSLVWDIRETMAAGGCIHINNCIKGKLVAGLKRVGFLPITIIQVWCVVYGNSELGVMVSRRGKKKDVVHEASGEWMRKFIALALAKGPEGIGDLVQDIVLGCKSFDDLAPGDREKEVDVKALKTVPQK